MDAIRSDNGVGGYRPGTSGHLEQCAGDAKLHRNSSRPGWITGALRVLGGSQGEPLPSVVKQQTSRRSCLGHREMGFPSTT